jgi:SAM-dependent methyltransferase
MTQGRPAVERNRALYESFWEEVPDFSRHNPGACHRRRLILDLVSQLQFASALDVGCGDALLLRFLRRARPDIGSLAGADLSPSQVARNRLRSPEMDFYVLDVERGMLDRRFDLVLSSEVIEHLDDPRSALTHLAAMVKAGGWLLITCPTGRMYATEEHFGHVRHPSSRELAELGTGAGLRVHSLTTWGWPTYRFSKWATNIDARWAIEHFARGPYPLSAKAVSRALYLANYFNLANHPWGCQLIALFRKERR